MHFSSHYKVFHMVRVGKNDNIEIQKMCTFNYKIRKRKRENGEIDIGCVAIGSKKLLSSTPEILMLRSSFNSEFRLLIRILPLSVCLNGGFQSIPTEKKSMKI